MSSYSSKPIQFVPAGLILRNVNSNKNSQSQKQNLSNESNNFPCLATRNSERHIAVQRQKPPRTICKQSSNSSALLLNKSLNTLSSASSKQSKSTVQKDLQNYSNISIGSKVRSNIFEKQDFDSSGRSSSGKTCLTSKALDEDDSWGEEICSVDRTSDPKPERICLTPTAESYNSDDSWGEDSFRTVNFEKKVRNVSTSNKTTVTSTNNVSLDLITSKTELSKREPSIKTASNSKETCRCGNCANYADCLTWCSKNIVFEHLQRDNERKGIPLLRLGKSKENKIKIACDNNMLIYGTYIFSPQQPLQEKVFNLLSSKGLEIVNSKELKSLGSYMSTSILRNLNVVAFGRRGEFENSLIYLPAFYSFALEKSERYAELKYEGPLILIIMPEEEKCLKLHNFMQKLLLPTDDEVSVGVLVNENSINCDIIITTPTAVDLNLRLGNLKLQRLCHLAIENASEVFQKNNMQQFFKLLHRFQELKPHNKNFQVVMCSELVTPELLRTINSFYSMPIIGFSDFLEAALLCNVEFKYKNINSNHKVFYLTDVLKLNNVSNKFVVFCDESEITTIEEHCTHNGIEFLSIFKNMTLPEISEISNIWSTHTSDVSKVLLCSDSLLEYVDVVCANRIIHYSPPSTYEEFQRRHRVLSKSLKIPFRNDEQRSDAISYVVKDEKSEFFENFHEIIKRNVLIQRECTQLNSSL